MTPVYKASALTNVPCLKALWVNHFLCKQGKEDTDLDAVKREKDLAKELDACKQELNKVRKGKIHQVVIT